MIDQLERAQQELKGRARRQALKALGVHEDSFWSNLGWMLLGAGVGALVTYMMDPDRGRRRQAVLRDQVAHAGAVVRHEVPQALRQATHRLNRAADTDPESPDWESEHNDDGALTVPTA